MLKQPLYQRDVITILRINLRCIPLAEAVGPDAFVSKSITDNRKLFLNCSFRNWEQQFISFYPIPQTIILNVLLYHKRNSKLSLFACFLFCDCEFFLSVTLNEWNQAEINEKQRKLAVFQTCSLCEIVIYLV